MSKEKTRNNFSIIRHKGIIESSYCLFIYIFFFIFVRITIFFLRIRGYNISYSVQLRGRNHFFQSILKGITIKDKVELGYGVKILSGQNGKIDIEKGVGIYDNTIIDIHEGLSIGENSMIAPFCSIIDYDHKIIKESGEIMKKQYTNKAIHIGKNVWIGTHAVILKGVTIGDNVVIGAGSIVTKDIPSFSLAVGNPARVIKHLKNDK